MVCLAFATVAGCHASPGLNTAYWPEETKIKFPLDNIRPDGLRGPADGLVAVSFEFCVPAKDQVYQEVLQIDSGLKIYPGSRGRIACVSDQALAIGETHHSHWREVLQELSRLSYVTEIRECIFE